MTDPRSAELEQSNAEILQAQQTLELSLNVAPDATVVVSRDGRIVSSNLQASELLGYSAAELQESLIEELIPQDLRGQHIAHRQQFSESPRTRSMGTGIELWALKKGGDRVPVDINLSPITIRNEDFVIAAIRDVSEHRTREHKLTLARQKADAANLAKSRFLATASHDLRQPLQSLGIYLSVIQRMIDDDKQSEVASKMRISLDSMADMLDALLDVSRLESGSVVPEMQSFAVKQLLDGARLEFEPAAQAKNLKLTVQDCDCQLYSDPVLLERVLDNLIGNAIKYTHSGEVRISCQPLNGRLRLSVTDTGQGIAEQDQLRIFEEYVQLENPQRDLKHGLGLGLSIVRYISRLLDVPIHIESELGQGTRIGVDIPLADEAGQALSQDTEDEQVPDLQSGTTALLVDNDENIVDALALLLQQAGAEVKTAVSYDAALSIMEAGFEPALIVTDYRLPKQSGLELISTARYLLGRQVPAVVITGDLALETDLDDVTILYKPVHEDRITECLAQISQGSSQS